MQLIDHQVSQNALDDWIHLKRALFVCFCSSGESTDRNADLKFSGLYSYHVPTNTWKLLREDSTELRSRIGHSMLFHPVRSHSIIHSRIYYGKLLTGKTFKVKMAIPTPINIATFFSLFGPKAHLHAKSCDDWAVNNSRRA